MKKIILFTVVFVISVNLCACTYTTDENNKLKITTTIFPYYSFANEIFQDDAEITMLIKPGSESHNYDPTPQDIIEIQKSDVFIYTGGESDKWVETIISSIDKNKTKIIKAIDSVNVLNSENEKHVHNHQFDEHIWTSIENSILITETIYNTIKNDKYLENKNNYIKRLEMLDEEFIQISNENPDKTLIFADRFPFSYFINRYNFKYISAFPSCSEESEPSIQKITQIINTVKNEKINGIFYIEFSNKKIAQTIQNETNTQKLLFHSCHNISAEDFESGISYYDLMEQNLINLKEAIK